MNSSQPTISYYEYLYTITQATSPTKLMYGWSKHGGGMKGMVQERNEEWSCQSCRRRFPDTVQSFMFPIYPREFGRICQSCLDMAIAKEMKTLWELMREFEKEVW